MVQSLRSIAVAILVGCSFCVAQKSIAQKQSEWFSEFATAGFDMSECLSEFATADCDIIIGSTFNTSFSPEEYDVYSGAFPADSLNAPLLIGTVKKETSPTIDEKYFVYKAPENEFRDEKPERPKTIPAGFHNPTILIGSEDRKNVNEAMSKVEKGLCYGSIAAMILSGGNVPILCEQHGTH